MQGRDELHLPHVYVVLRSRPRFIYQCSLCHFLLLLSDRGELSASPDGALMRMSDPGRTDRRSEKYRTPAFAVKREKRPYCLSPSGCGSSPSCRTLAPAAGGGAAGDFEEITPASTRKEL